jgi:PHS family inorganic phosphate transporter-like MFS transporter
MHDTYTYHFIQFFFNFGANTTTYMYPAELFPTRFRAFAHGISAAAGKSGAIISALAFNALSKKVGTPIVLWSMYFVVLFCLITDSKSFRVVFFGCCIAGALFTLLLPEVRARDPDVILAEEMKEGTA